MFLLSAMTLMITAPLKQGGKGAGDLLWSVDGAKSVWELA